MGTGYWLLATCDDLGILEDGGVRLGVRGDHPIRVRQVLADQENDWCKVVDWLTGPIPEGKAIFYQKHMAHHLLDNINHDWLGEVTNCFLIRQPKEMLTSLLHRLPEPTLADTGLAQQVEIVEFVRLRTGSTPAIVDARDVLDNPRQMLTLLCDAVGVPFTEAMLSWPPGRRRTDGIWAKHWYDAVEKSTGFQPYRLKHEEVPEGLHGLLAECEALYERLHPLRLQWKNQRRRK